MFVLRIVLQFQKNNQCALQLMISGISLKIPVESFDIFLNIQLSFLLRGLDNSSYHLF